MMSNVINLDSRRPKPEPPPQFRHSFWEWISKKGGEVLIGLLIVVTLAFCVWLVSLGPPKEMIEACKPDHYIRIYKVAEGLHRIDCMTSTGQVRYIYKEDK